MLNSVPLRIAVFTDCSEEQDNRHSSQIRMEYYPLVEFSPVTEFHQSFLSRWKGLVKGNPGYLLFTSRRAVKFFADIVIASNTTPDCYNKEFSKVITVGPTTLSALELFLGSHGFKVDYQADKEGRGQGQQGVWELVYSQKLNPIIHVCPVYVDNFLEKQFIKHGYIYDRYPIYKTLFKKVNQGIKEQILKCDYLLFTSSSTIMSFWDNFEDSFKRYLKKNTALPPALFIGESSERYFQEIKKKEADYPEVKNWKTTILSPGKELIERIIKTVNFRRVGY